ncbi:hypothetical protein DYQ86_02685 [Acidobacteria bacterium AB60]|nr:hypothetical protein DYQ86_02685 [Acidobacteria bacterium AB60]
MRIVPAIVLFSALSIPAFASSLDDKLPDQQTLDALEQRASVAQPKEQCFLYAQLVHQMIELSARQVAAGDVEKATGLLKRAQEFTHRIHMALAGNDKRLKDAQILLRHTSFRLAEMLHAGSFDDRPLVEQTLAQLNRAQDEAMLQVFRK